MRWHFSGPCLPELTRHSPCKNRWAAIRKVTCSPQTILGLEKRLSVQCWPFLQGTWVWFPAPLCLQLQGTQCPLLPSVGTHTGVTHTYMQRKVKIFEGLRCAVLFMVLNSAYRISSYRISSSSLFLTCNSSFNLSKILALISAFLLKYNLVNTIFPEIQIERKENYFQVA